ncbi:MAG: tRNA (adenosine(37)-N6)-threonylcarbamoyltransferase complex ATPase subunit type 1 TsaE [Balneolaceae bacterium]
MKQIQMSHSEDETMNIASEFAKSVDVGDIICLYGNLGAGKTQFVKGFVREFGINPDVVTSPTFSIIQEYIGTIPVYHFDFYRLEKPEESLEIGVEEYFFGNGVCIIEWPERLEGFLPEHCIRIEIKQTGLSTRSLEIPHVV